MSRNSQIVKKEELISKELILIKHNLIEIPTIKGYQSRITLGTILANLAYYGYTFSNESLLELMKIEESVVGNWWINIEKSLKEITGDNRNMGDFVVYKNFPKEVLSMTESEYWIKQIFMYIGFPNDWFTTEELVRDKNIDKLQLKVLQLSNNNSLQNVLNTVISLPNKWITEQYSFILYLIFKEKLNFDLNKISFKENLITLTSDLIEENITVKFKSATDVLRLGIGLSDGDVSMKTNSKFRNFKRSERKFLLNLLEKSTNLKEDIARDKNKWKKFIANLHPGDYKKFFPNVVSAYDHLYNNVDILTFNSQVEKGIREKDETIINLLQTRPGEFVRRLFNLLTVFNPYVVAAKFYSITNKLTVVQLLKLKGQLTIINGRQFKTFAPKGNWNKLQVVENKTKIDPRIKNSLIEDICLQIRDKVSKVISKVNLGDDTNFIKLQTNDSDLSPYGRGTVFPIPDNVNFIRTASYWQNESQYTNTWFDNGWNFFDEEWNSVSTCCWTDVKVSGAVFSGDPTNSKEMKGRACQMIDLYLDELEKANIRYAVWNILAYSNIKFSDATDVFAALQWGENEQTGKLFEPSRCQLSFPIKGANLTKYIAYLDMKERKVIYMDANLKGNVQSANTNGKTLEKVMPAYVEYLKALPSVYDIFENLSKDKNGTYIGYYDKNTELKDQVEAYVFKPVNENNSFKQLNLIEIINM